MEAIRGIVAQYRKLLPSRTNPYSQEIERKSAQFDKLAAKLAKVLSLKLPAKEEMSLHPSLDRLSCLLRELEQMLLGSWRIESELTLEQWVKLSPKKMERAVRVIAENGVADVDLRRLRIADWACEVGKERLEKVVAADPIAQVRQIAESLVAEARRPRPEVPAKFWNKARKFNPQRILSLRPCRLALRGTPDGCSATLEFSNLAEALALPEKKKSRHPVIWPKHPTLPVPWRCLYRTHEMTLHEKGLGTSLLNALMALAREKIIVENFAAERRSDPEVLKLLEGILDEEELEASKKDAEVLPSLAELTLQDAVGMILDEEEEEVNFLDPEDPTPQCERYLFAPDHPELPVVSTGPLAGGANALALKAREIWFQRFRELLEPALPPARRATLFLLEERAPRSPFRTFAVKLKGRSRQLKLPKCPECGKACDVAINLNFTHHDLPFRLPGFSLLLQTCSEHNGVADWWHCRWLSRTAKPELQALLKSAEVTLAGPAVKVVEYDDEAVDEELIHRSGPKAEAYHDSWEKTYGLFASSHTKVGGGVFWIQGNPGLMDSAGKPLQFIGQVGSNEFIEMFDAGILYILYSPDTQETVLSTQCY